MIDIVRVLRRLPSAAATAAMLAPLALRNRISRKAVAGRAGPVVSITTHGPRIRSVYLALESIARGSELPSSLILYLDPDRKYQPLPKSIQRLQVRGLTVAYSDKNYGPHTKYYPYVVSHSPHEKPLVTADDDILYPKYWLKLLNIGSSQRPDSIVGYRVHRVRLQDDQVAPYRAWEAANDTAPSILNFATGVSGVIYPPSFLDYLRRAGDDFLTSCRHADDVWLHISALRSGTPVAQLLTESRHFRVIPLTQSVALAKINTVQDGNDEQIRAAYRKQDIGILLEANSREPGHI